MNQLFKCRDYFIFLLSASGISQVWRTRRKFKMVILFIYKTTLINDGVTFNFFGLNTLVGSFQKDRCNVFMELLIKKETPKPTDKSAGRGEETRRRRSSIQVGLASQGQVRAGNNLPEVEGGLMPVGALACASRLTYGLCRGIAACPCPARTHNTITHRVFGHKRASAFTCAYEVSCSNTFLSLCVRLKICSPGITCIRAYFSTYRYPGGTRGGRTLFEDTRLCMMVGFFSPVTNTFMAAVRACTHAMMLPAQ